MRAPARLWRKCDYTQDAQDTPVLSPLNRRLRGCGVRLARPACPTWGEDTAGHPGTREKQRAVWRLLLAAVVWVAEEVEDLLGRVAEP